MIIHLSACKINFQQKKLKIQQSVQSSTLNDYKKVRLFQSKMTANEV